MSTALLERTTFRTSRLLDFCSQKELINQTGHPIAQWPLVIFKELVDNAIDACEEARTAPVISVSVNRGEITVTDNGPGLKPGTVADILDYTVRASSREAYVSPTRGAQGNALKTIVAMPFALDGDVGRVTIEAHKVAHHIEFRVDHIRQEPKISHDKEVSDVKTGTRITVHWPDSACSNLAAAERRFLQMAEDYVWLNPHLSLTVSWNGKRRPSAPPSNPAWAKWRPSDPTSPHWYTPERFERLMAGYVAHEQGSSGPKTVREFIAEFRGLSSTAKQKIVLANTGTSGRSLAEFFCNGEADKAAIAKLLAEMQAVSRPVKPKDLGVIGKDHLAGKFKAAGIVPESFQYKCTLLMTDGLPVVVEAAFGFCPKAKQRRQVLGVNWSPSIINPFRSLGGKSLDAILTEQRAGDPNEPIIFLLHLAHPRVEYSDRGKSSVNVDAATAAALIESVLSVTKKWAKQRKAEERHAAALFNRIYRMSRLREDTIKDLAYEVMEEAYLKASANGTLPAHARQIMYQARPLIQAKTEKQLDDQYFCQQLLPNYMQENDVDWNVVYDDRGHFTEPHTETTIGLGTLNVRNYLGGMHQPKLYEAELKPAGISTRGPAGSYGAVMFTEKEGFNPLFEASGLAKRFDIALMSTKGLSNTAARTLIDSICGGHDVPLSSCMTSTNPASASSARYSARPAGSASNTITG